MIPLKYNVRNLIVRWKTTLLTAVGFTLVVALLVVMLAFVNGLNELSKKTGPEGNVIILRDGANDEIFSEIALDDRVSELWNNHEEIIRDGDTPRHSLEVYSIATQEMPLEREGARPRYRFLQIRGVEDPRLSAKVHGLGLKEGEWFSPVGNEVVMGDGIARTLGLKVGDPFEIRPELKWQVVGIMNSRGTPFDSEIWAKREEVGYYFKGGSDSKGGGRRQSFYTSIVVTTKDLATAESFAADLKNRTQVRVAAFPERKYYEEMNKTNQIFLGAAIFIAVIMAIGGMFGLMNTMFAAVSQRIKDIGVLRVLGYKPWQILASFLFESLLLASIGGLAGVLLGYSVNGIEQTGVMSSGQGGGKTVVFTMIVSGWVILTAAGFTLGMGLLGGILPAFSAMRLKLLESLK
jgi:ABC-type antimicrobial peptide transport system permease subunit